MKPALLLLLGLLLMAAGAGWAVVRARNNAPTAAELNVASAP